MVLVMEYPHKETNNQLQLVMVIFSCIALDNGDGKWYYGGKMTFRMNGYPTKDVKKKKR